MKRILIILSFFVPLTILAQGPISGFLPAPGQWDLAYSYSRESFSTFFDENGERTDRALLARSHNFFLEHGLNQRSSLVISAPYIHNDRTNQGLQDGGLWLKYRNERNEQPQGAHNVLTAVGLSFPLSGYANDNPLAIGRRASTFHGRLVWQYEASYGWFLHLQSGIDFQFAPVAQAALPILVRGGVGTSWFYADAWLERYQSLDGQANGPQLTAGTGSTWTRVGGTLYFPLRAWVGVLGGLTYVIDGKNIGYSQRWHVGVVFRLP